MHGLKEKRDAGDKRGNEGFVFCVQKVKNSDRYAANTLHQATKPNLVLARSVLLLHQEPQRPSPTRESALSVPRALSKTTKGAGSCPKWGFLSRSLSWAAAARRRGRAGGNGTVSRRRTEGGARQHRMLSQIGHLWWQWQHWVPLCCWQLDTGVELCPARDHSAYSRVKKRYRCLQLFPANL